MPRVLAVLLLLGFCLPWFGSAERPSRATENVVLITLDGARLEEIFGGLDLEILQSVAKDQPVEEHPLYRTYWAPTPEERRRRLMPFFWGVLMARHGSIAGNRALGSTAELTNTRRISYPGYAEILTGQARDDVINSNDERRNPFPTVLEFLKRKLDLSRDEVAAFASWRTFKWIVEHEEGALTVNAGFDPYDHPDPAVQQLSGLQFETPTPWDSVRHDVYTFRFAMAHLERHRPRVLYLALGETDDWAHDSRYDRVLDALRRTDGHLQELWNWLQQHPQYRDKTTMVITVDHGRGNTPGDWGSHGSRVERSRYVWMAFVSPDSTLRGEWSQAPTIYSNQIAATLCRALGFDYREQNRDAGAPIERLFENR